MKPGQMLILGCWAAAAYGIDLSTNVFFSEGWTADKVDYTESTGEGNWTTFLDADRPYGMGEFEDVWRERMYYKIDCRALWCLHPVAMEVGLSLRIFKWKPNATLDDAWRCTNLPSKMDPKDGFLCLARNQKRWRKRNPVKDPICYNVLCNKNGLKKDCRRCFDARVRYFCLRDDLMCLHNVFVGTIGTNGYGP